MKYYNALTDKIISVIRDYDYISFDIFDTLLKRDVPNPHIIFTLMEDMLESKLRVKIDNFCRKRIEAERIARKHNRGKEVTLRRIYEASNDIMIRKHADRIMKLEEEVEYKASCANYPMQAVYNWCIKNNKHVFLVSDMYLQEEYIVSLLSKNNYEKYERLFLSSTWGKRKADNGALFGLACSELNIQPNKLIHVGDSEINDGKMAKKIGCNSVVIRRNLGTAFFFKGKSFFYKHDLQYKILKSFCENRLFLERDYFYSFGYQAFGPFLVGYSKWLYNEIKKENIRQLYFFSRDGLIIKKAFDILYDKEDSMHTNYLLVSRRSLRVPYIWLHPEYSDVIKGFPEASMQSIVTFFDTLGLNITDYEMICEKLGINKQYVYIKNEMSHNNKLIALYDEIKIDVISNSKREYAALLKYLNEQISDKKLAVIDIGWHGSMQKFLMEILDSADVDVTLFGYYVGLAAGSRRYSEEGQFHFKGYLFDLNANPKAQDLRSPFVGLLETLFLAQEGSTKRYFVDGEGNVKVEFYDNEYETEDGIPTKDSKNVALIQEGALRFVRDYRDSILSEISFCPEVLFKNIYGVGMNPSKTDLRNFGDMEFRDGEMLKLAAPKTFMSYCRKPQSLVKDFYNSRWKIGFMKRLLKLPLPYGKMYDLLKRV